MLSAVNGVRVGSGIALATRWTVTVRLLWMDMILFPSGLSDSIGATVQVSLVLSIPTPRGDRSGPGDGRFVLDFEHRANVSVQVSGGV